MTVQDIINLIKEQTRDTGSVTWTSTDIMQYINEGVKNTIQRAPEANSKKQDVPIVPGVDQQLPSDAVYLINIISNAAGRTIFQANVEDKDAFSPEWKKDRPAAYPIEWMKRSEPTKFLLWPPVKNNSTVLAEYSFYPADVTGVNDSILVANEFLEPVRLWALYRTFSRDSDNTPSVERAAQYLQQFEQFFAKEGA